MKAHPTMSLPQPSFPTIINQLTTNTKAFRHKKIYTINHDEHDQGHIRQTSPGAEEALGKQASASVSIAQPGDDRLFGSHDLEGSHVLYQGTLVFYICCWCWNKQI